MAASFIGNVDYLCTDQLLSFTPRFAIIYLSLMYPVISQSDLDEGPNLNSFLWCRLASVTR